jgi:hypothetical protein
VARLDRRAARRLDRAGHRDRRGDVEVGARDAQLVLLGFEQHGREDRERALRGDRGKRGRQCVRQIRLLDREFHSPILLSRGCCGGLAGAGPQAGRTVPNPGENQVAEPEVGARATDPLKVLLILFSLKKLKDLEPVGAVDL